MVMDELHRKRRNKERHVLEILPSYNCTARRRNWQRPNDRHAIQLHIFINYEATNID